MRRIRSWERFKWASEVKIFRGETSQQFLKDTAELLASIRGSPGCSEDLTASLLPTNKPGHITPHTSGVCKYMGVSEIHRRVSVKRQSQLRDPLYQHHLPFHRIFYCFYDFIFPTPVFQLQGTNYCPILWTSDTLPEIQSFSLHFKKSSFFCSSCSKKSAFPNLSLVRLNLSGCPGRWNEQEQFPPASKPSDQSCTCCSQWCLTHFSVKHFTWWSIPSASPAEPSHQPLPSTTDKTFHSPATSRTSVPAPGEGIFYCC